MHDMIVRLYRLPDIQEGTQALAQCGIRIRRCMPYELLTLQHWVSANFSPKWLSEATVAMAHQPPGCLIATRDSAILGFVCVDATMRGFLGPMGLVETARGQGIGRMLLLTALHEMRHMGYAYAILGGVGPVDFYRKVAAAEVIPNSTPGIYEDLLPDPPSC